MDSACEASAARTTVERRQDGRDKEIIMAQAENQREGETAAELELLRSLVRELFQEERSAQRHCDVEARRLGDTPPAQSLVAVTKHAEATLAELPGQVRNWCLPLSKTGLFAGTAFSVLRERLADAVLTTERSYRVTLLGVRHGVDLVTLLKEVALGLGMDDLTQWCDRWLAARTPMARSLEEHMAWFAANPAVAVRPSDDTMLARGAHALLSGIDRIEQVVGARLNS